ncbi:hypothetical protein MXE79_12270 [Enterococcus faecium]|nr:hydantoinase/oxoprolinase N-terminal domain-containing protein [Enterococcus faecium]MEB5977284.1 hypothetical protein [Enterococcus faecium]
MKRFVRMGIDVGGTHTKAVAIDNATHEIIGKSSVKTTHDHLNGVAAGVVQSFQNCLQENQISPDDVVFVAHSTTQATNALIEGDVAKVGVIGMSKGGLEGFLAKRQTRLNDIDLGNKKKIEIVNAFLQVKHLNVDRVAETISNLEKEKAEVLVSSMAFGVDNGELERVVYEAASCKAIPTTMASDITKLYGLTDIGTPIVKQHNGINEITLYYDLPLFFYFIIGLTFIGWLILFIMFIRSRIHS